MQRNNEEIKNLDQERFDLVQRLDEISRYTVELRDENQDQDIHIVRIFMEKCT